MWGWRVVIVCGALLCGIGSGQARELLVSEAELVRVELLEVRFASDMHTPVVWLREPDSGAGLPIYIGMAQARAIVQARRGVPGRRPGTHDLLASMIASLSGTLERVVVDALHEGVYLGAVEVRLRDDVLHRLDARPSDALALAVRTGADIVVARELLESREGRRPDDRIAKALGMTVVAASAPLREALRLPSAEGVLVTAAAGRAALAGVRPGALIIGVNASVPTDPARFLELVRQTPFGAAVALEVWSEGVVKRISLPVVAFEPPEFVL